MKSIQKAAYVISIMLILMLSYSTVGASQKVNYQGYLTDSDGNPVADNNYQILFTLYDITGGPLWNSGPVTVPVTSGLFNFILGSSTDLPDSVFQQGDLYLGIKVGEDPEIDPRTLLTSAPSAAVATNLAGGSLESKEGAFVMRNNNGDSAMVFIANYDSHVIRIHPPEPCVPPDPCLPAIELMANNENRIDLYYPGEEAEAGIVQMGAGPDVGGFISIHNAEPLLGEGIRLTGSATNNNTITMYGGGHAAEYKLLEMNSQTGEGASMSFFDPENVDGREMMTLSSTPTEGTSLVGFNPQPEPPGFPAFELGINSAKDGPGSYFRLNSPVTGLLDEPMISMTTSPADGPIMEFFNPSSTLPNNPYIKMGVEPNPYHTGRLEFFAPDGTLPNDPYIKMGIEPSPTYPGGAFSLLDPAHGAVMEMMGNATDGASMKMFQPQPEPPGREAISINTDPTSGFSIKMFQPQPEPPGQELISMSTMPSSGASIKMFQPQPEPPGIVALEMATSSRGAGGYLATYNNTDSVRSVLVGGNLSCYDMTSTYGPSAGFGIQPTKSEMDLTGPRPASGGPAALISMLADSNGAYISIGTDSIPEALTVMGNGWFSGDCYIFTATKAKKNIEPIDNALEKVSRMNGYYYDCRTDEYPSLRMPEARQVGFLAEEVKKVVPEIVGENDYGLTGVDYSRITALLVEAVKELKIENEKQAELIEKLQQEIDELK